MADTTGMAAAEAFIQKKRDEVRKARQRVERLEDALRHYEEIYNVIHGATSRGSAVKSGSQAEGVIRVLSDAGEPTHIDEIMARMGVECTPAAKNSLTGSLSRYVRQGQIFTRPAPGTFGLIKWSNESDEDAETDARVRPSINDLLAQRARQSVQLEDESPF